MKRQRDFLLVAKMAFDKVVVAVAMCVALPVFAVVAASILVTIGRPVLFRQVRVGVDGKLFTILKFRTMSDARDAAQRLLPDAVRLGPLGRFLRTMSLDELPQLINVWRGEMSLVGPRPLPESFMDYYTSEQAERHDVLPGITGWAQVNGRNSLTWEEKFCFDVWYARNWSLWLDFRILVKTIPIVLLGRDIAASGHATSTNFYGAKPSGEP